MKGMKRRPATPMGGKKKKRTSSAQNAKAQYAMIANALRHAPWIPGSYTNLLTSVSSSLGVPKDLRHPQQQTVVAMLGDGLLEIEHVLQAKVAAAKVHVDNAPAEKVKRDTALQNAHLGLQALEADVEEKKASRDGATATEIEEKAVLKEKQDNENSAEKVVNAMQDMKSKLDAMHAAFGMADTIKMSGRDSAQKAPRAFVKIGRELGLEMEMLSKLPEILAKAPEARTEFDHFATEKFGQAIAKLGEVYGDSALEAAEATKAERAAAVAAATDVLMQASEAKAACAAELTDASAAVRIGKGAVADAKKTVAKYVGDMKVYMDAFDNHTAELAAFQDGPLATFNDLKDKVAPTEEAEVGGDVD